MKITRKVLNHSQCQQHNDKSYAWNWNKNATKKRRVCRLRIVRVNIGIHCEKLQKGLTPWQVQFEFILSCSALSAVCKQNLSIHYFIIRSTLPYSDAFSCSVLLCAWPCIDTAARLLVWHTCLAVSSVKDSAKFARSRGSSWGRLLNPLDNHRHSWRLPHCIH